MKTKQTKQLAQIIQSLYVLAVVSGLPLGQRAWGLPGDLLLTIHNPTPVADDWFGYSVAAVGTNLLVGAPMKDSGAANAGAVYLFNGKTGDLLLSIYNPFPGQGDLFGWSVAGAGDNILVGAPYND
ncbi:hypothetical protein HY256_09735, partial [Candidatus Sumerlaeota bacterium]|nr:hypothetical protein [Candidatus Sumerlaeota bacterium]